MFNASSLLVKPTMAKMHSGLLYSGGFLLENILWLSMAFLFTRMHNADVRICLLEIKDPLQISKATPSGSWFLNNWVSMSLYCVVQGFRNLLNTRVVHGYLLLLTSVPWRIRFNDVGIFFLKNVACSLSATLLLKDTNVALKKVVLASVLLLCLPTLLHYTVHTYIS